jgi:hypothetical protein
MSRCGGARLGQCAGGTPERGSRRPGPSSRWGGAAIAQPGALSIVFVDLTLTGKA